MFTLIKFYYYTFMYFYYVKLFYRLEIRSRKCMYKSNVYYKKADLLHRRDNVGNVKIGKFK